MDYQLDTSGTVDGKSWEDIAPLTQGYVEALFAALNRFECRADCLAPCIECLDEAGFAKAFSDLAPATLARIVEDCAERSNELKGMNPGWGHDVSEGRRFWVERVAGDLPHYAPLAPYLADDGKVHLREAR